MTRALEPFPGRAVLVMVDCVSGSNNNAERRILASYLPLTYLATATFRIKCRNEETLPNPTQSRRHCERAGVFPAVKLMRTIMILATNFYRKIQHVEMSAFCSSTRKSSAGGTKSTSSQPSVAATFPRQSVAKHVQTSLLIDHETTNQQSASRRVGG